MNPIDIVAGHEKLTELFGGWPSYHDAEVISLRLERRGSDEWESPTLEADIHLFKGRRSETQPDKIEFYDHVVATLRFGLVVGLELFEFNAQNVLFDLYLEEPADAPSIAPFRVTFDSSYGIGGSFYCRSISVGNVSPGLPEFSVYRAERMNPAENS